MARNDERRSVVITSDLTISYGGFQLAEWSSSGRMTASDVLREIGRQQGGLSRYYARRRTSLRDARRAVVKAQEAV